MHIVLFSSAQVPDARTIMEKSRELSLAGSLTATISLVITEKTGAARARTISMTSKSFGDGTEKRFIRFLEPPDVRGTSMLVYDYKTVADEMWIYLPALKKVRRIVTSEKGKSFMSSEFSNADLGSPNISDFKYLFIDNPVDSDLWVIESTPVNEKLSEEYGFSRKVSHIRKGKYEVRKMELYDFEGKLFKIIEITEVQTLSGGRYMVKEMSACNIKTGRKSVISFTNITEGIKVDDSVFSLQNLER